MAGMLKAKPVIPTPKPTYDSRGAKVKTIATGHTQAKKYQTLEINLTNYAQGVYLLKLITDNKVTSKPLVIQP